MDPSWPRVSVDKLGEMTEEQMRLIAGPGHTTNLSSAPVPHCTECGLMEYQLAGKLKRCGGCAVSMYCSKECQKKAWPDHKAFCRRSDDPSVPRPDGHSFSGYPSAIILANAIKLWVEIHDYGFTVITSATVLLHTLAPADFSSPSPPAFRFIIDLGDHSEGIEGNPAKAFKLIEAAVVRKEELGPLMDRESWVDTVAFCREATEAKRREVPNHIVAAVLPAVFIMANTGLTSWHQFPVYLPQRNNAFALDDFSRALVGDANEMCTEAMNAGDIFRRPDVYKPTPDLGTVIKRKKRWQWKGRDEHAYWDALSRRMARSGSPYKSGLPPPEIWARFQRL